MRTKTTIALLVAVVLFYSVVIAVKGVSLLTDGSVVAALLGAALLVLPVLGLFVLWREIEFGRRTGAMARVLEDEGELPLEDLPRRPSGRVDRGAADAHFADMREQADASPEDWRTWFRLALAYDAAGDRTRARAAARHAIELRA